MLISINQEVALSGEDVMRLKAIEMKVDCILETMQAQQTEKLDVENGFLMCPDHDKLFDQGWITFDENGNIVVADELFQEDRI